MVCKISRTGVRFWHKDTKHQCDSGTVTYDEWWKVGLHREDGPAAIWEDSTAEWWKDGKLDRTDGPAVEHPDGYKAWYQYGKLHRLDGPAREYTNGSKEYWIDGTQYTKEIWEKYNGM